MKAFRIHGNRSGHLVGNPREIDAQDAVHDLHPFAADPELVQGAVHVHLPVQGALEAVEDPGEERGGIAHVQAVELRGGPDGLVLRTQVTVHVEVPDPVLEVPQLDVEPLLGFVPDTGHFQGTHRPAGQEGGVADDAGEQGRRRLRRGDKARAARRLSLDVHLPLHHEGVQQGDVELVHPHGQGVVLVGGQAAVDDQRLLSVTEAETVHPEVAALEREVVGVHLPAVAVVVDGGGEHGGDDGEAVGAAGEVGREPELRLVGFLGLVVEGVGEADAVVVDHRVDMVVLEFEAAQVDGRAGHVGVERVVPVVEIQPEILQEAGAEGEPSGGDVPVDDAVFALRRREEFFSMYRPGTRNPSTSRVSKNLKFIS